MKEPLVLLLYERVLPGGRLANRLQDLGYRVQLISDPGSLVTQSERDKPLLVIVDLEVRRAEMMEAISSLRNNAGTTHIPVIAYLPEGDSGLFDAGRAAGATLVVSDTAAVLHLDQFLQQALQVE